MSDFTTVTSVGGLLPTDLLARVAANDNDLPGTSAEDYGLVPGERLNDHVTRSWNRLVGLWQNFQRQLDELPDAERTATSLTRDRWTIPLLDELGFAGLPTAKAQSIQGKDYPISHEWDSQVPLHLPGARILIDRRTPGIPGAATTSPHGLVQEYLNRSDNHLWGIVSNGLVLRLLRDNASLTRQAYVEFDLAAMFDGEAFSDFVLLWLCCHRTRFAGDPPEKCLLEQWSQEAVTSGTRALDKLRDGVETAVTELGEGFIAHPANGPLRDSLRSGALPKDEYQRQLLRIVYRLLFLLVAESRDLLLDPAADGAAKERYRQYYSVDRLRRLARARRGTSHDDLWAGLTVVMRALHHDGAPSLALAPLGSFLWAPDAITNLTGSSIDNRHLLDAIRALTLVRDDESRVHRTVDYRNLGAEELGSIYESLLELHAEVDPDARTFRLDTAAGNERKTTGSYYTPTSLITELLDSALDPVLDEACNQPDAESAILNLSMIDMAIGSGHFAIAAANRIAQRLALIRAGGVEPAPDEVRTALRDVIGRCIHGIDVNPMAVELCKVSLWLEAMEPGKPLSFLDHRIVCGNALLGTTPRLLSEGIPDDAYKPLLGDDKSMVTSLKKRNKQEREGQLSLGLGGSPAELAKPLADAYSAIDAVEDSSLDKITEKHHLYQHLAASPAAQRARLAADAWCAAFIAPKATGEPEITTDTVRRIGDDPTSVDPAIIERVRALSDEFRFLHLHLAFPDVIRVSDDTIDQGATPTGWSGGFDVVLGNPPWERVKLQEKEFFAERDERIATAPNKSARSALIAALRDAEPTSPDRALAREWDRARRHAAAEAHLMRSSGAFPLGAVGDINVYAVFADLFRQSISSTGRAGFICPTGLAVGATYADFFAEIVNSRSLVSFYSFENEDRIFSSVHNETKFALVTLTGTDRSTDKMSFTGYVRQAHEIHDSARKYDLSVADIRALNPNTLTAPLFRRSRDAALLAHIHTVSETLVDEHQGANPWDVGFVSSMFHSANDSASFNTDHDLREIGATRSGPFWTTPGGDLYVPLLEGKMIWHYDYRYGTYQGQTEKQRNKGVLPRVGDADHADPCYWTEPRYWVQQKQVDDELDERWDRSWFLGFRDVGPSERTMICSVIPRRGAVDKLPLILSARSARESAFLCAQLSSFVLDFALRQKTAGNMKLFVVKQAPILPPPSESEGCPWGEPMLDFVVPRVVELTYTSWELSQFAADCGYRLPPFQWNPARRDMLQAELDALILLLFRISRADTESILDSFRVLRKYEERPPDRGGFGEYRTRRLILEAFDRMTSATAEGSRYVPFESTPPADPSLCHPRSSEPEWAKRSVNS